MNAVWSLTCTALPAWVALLLLLAATGAVLLLQERRALLIALRIAAVLIAVGLVADLTLSRSTTAQVPPPVAVVLDVSASMGVADRQLPADRLLDWAVALGVIDGRRRSDGPRRMGAVLSAVQVALPALATGAEVAGLRQRAAELEAAGASAAGYRDAERLCRETAATLLAVADGGSRDQLVPLAPAIAALLPRLATEQAAGDAALLAGWRAANDPAAAAIGLLATTPRGVLAARLVRERLLPLLATRGSPATFALSDRLLAVTPESLAPGTAGTDFAAIADLARGWATSLTPGALILISDGRNHGGDPRPALRALLARGAHLTLLGVGDSGAPDEPALIDLDGPEAARAGARITLSATVRPGGAGWEMVLSIAAADGTPGVEVARQALPASGSANTTLRLTVDTGTPGLRRYTARLEKPGAVPGPVLTCPVRVTDTPVRVVVVDGLPRWETRALVAALESDPLVAVERRFLQGPAPVTTALPAEALRTADAVVLGDLTPAELPTDDQMRLAAFVADGGFLVVEAGPRGMPAGFPLGPLADLLPIRPVRDGAPASASAALALTPAGELHRICRLLGDSDLDRRLWAALPGPDWLAGGVAARPDATVLVNATTGPGANVPAIAVAAVGAGQVLWCGIPESWRWQAFAHGRAHTAFWTNVLRWGIATRPYGRDPRLHVALTPGRIDAQGSSELLVTSINPGADPSAILTGSDGQPQPLTLVPAGDGRWRASIADPDEGLHRVTVNLDVGPQTLREERDLLVRPLAARELADPTADLATLRLLANDLGATYVEVADATAAITRVAGQLTPQTVSTTRTWRSTDGPWAAGLLLLLLGVEWVLRKRRGLP